MSRATAAQCGVLSRYRVPTQRGERLVRPRDRYVQCRAAQATYRRPFCECEFEEIAMRFDCEAAAVGEEAKLDFLLDVPSHYFKSSFARSVLNDSKAPRSLDAVTLCGGAGRRKGLAPLPPLLLLPPPPPPPPPPLEEDDVQLQAPSGRIRAQTSEVARIWKLKQTAPPLPPPPPSKPPHGRSPRSREAATDPPPPSCPACPSIAASVAASAAELDAQRLRKECQGLQDENRRLHGVLEAARDTSVLLDTARLQSQVDTLAWQLKQTEASRQTYRRVMEQVVLFLERTHKSLDHLRQGSPPNGSTTLSNGSSPNCRVPRSRSVHTVDVSPSRASPRSDSVLRFPRAKSIAQIEETQNYSTFRDFTWRRPRKVNTDHDCVTPEKLSEESFRLLRLVQSLLNVQEPDLTQRIGAVSDTASVTSSVTDHMPDTSYPNSISQRSSTTSSGLDMADDKGSVLELHSLNKKLLKHNSPASLSLTCNSPVPSTCSRIHSSPDTISIHSAHSTSSKTLEYKNTALTSGLESGFAGHTNHSRKSSNLPSPKLDKDDSVNGYSTNGTSPKQQLSEDESGFSSMSSFQEVGVPVITPPPLPSSSPNGLYQEVGLPLIENHTLNNSPSRNHRRWSSTPVTGQTQFPPHSRSFCLPGESLKVLWV